MMTPDNPTHPGSPSQTEIYLAAAELHGEERARYLEVQCGKDAALRARVEALLAAEEPPEDFMEEVSEAPEGGGTVTYFGDYVLLGEIARGSSGVVFRALQTSLNRVVAVKMLRDHGRMASLGDQQRFRGEAEAVAKLDHPGIAPIYEVGEHAGQGYFSMKFVEGGTLQLRSGEFRERRKAAALIVKVARAVHHAHEHGILHRDLKPGNILLDRNGEPQVVDFGIARNLGLDSGLTQTGQILGTPHYMPPEQARGENSGLTAAADVYSLGAILYELLAGKKPFDAPTMLSLLQEVVEEPPAPLQLGDRDLENIVMHCLEKSPTARYASATELADDLERWQRGEPVQARSLGRLRRMGKWIVRRPAHAALIAMSLVAVGSLAAFFLREPDTIVSPATSPAPAPPAQPYIAQGSPAASRRAAEWLLQVKGSPSHVLVRLVAGRTLVQILSGQGLPPEDFYLEELMLDRLNAPEDLPPVTDQEITSYLTSVTQLKCVMVRNFPLRSGGFAFLSSNPDLEMLTLSEVNIGDEIVDIIYGLKKLRVLWLAPGSNKTQPFTGAQLDRLACLPVLETGTFYGTSFGDLGLRALARAPKLNLLHLESTQVTDDGLKWLAESVGLEKLILTHCAITDLGLAALVNVKPLNRLQVNFTKVTRRGLTDFLKARPDVKLFAGDQGIDDAAPTTLENVGTIPMKE